MRKVVDVCGTEFVVTDEHAASSYGVPVVVCPDGEALGDADLFDTGDFVVTGAQVKALAEAEEIAPEDLQAAADKWDELQAGGEH